MRLYVGLLSSIAFVAFALQTPTVAAAEPSDSTAVDETTAARSDPGSGGAPSQSWKSNGGGDGQAGPEDVGIYIAPQVNIASMFDDTGVLVGGRMAFVFDGAVSFGGGGVRLVNDVNLGNTVDGNGERQLDMTYGGAVLGATPWTEAGLHPTIDLMIGGGRIQFSDPSPSRVSDGFFIMEATAGLEWNIVEGIRLNVSGGYRHTAGASLQGIEDRHLSGAVGMATLRFGAF